MSESERRRVRLTVELTFHNNRSQKVLFARSEPDPENRPFFIVLSLASFVNEDEENFSRSLLSFSRGKDVSGVRCYLVSTSPLSHPTFPVSLQHIYSAMDTLWITGNLSILLIHSHHSRPKSNNISKYLWDLLWLLCGLGGPGSPGSWSEPGRLTLTKFVTDSIPRNVNKQLVAARERWSRPQRTRLRCLIVVTTLADGPVHKSVLLLLSYHQPSRA